jgi:NADH-ubiquinone oxidoreductase chain 5
MRDEQDMRRLGGVSNTMPITYICVLIGSLSLSGFPFLSGFYSKDVILETALGSYTVTGYFAFWLGSVTAFLTAFYSFRLFYIGFMQETSSLRSIVTGSHESGIAIIVPLTTLALGSIFSGYYFRDVFIGLGSDVFAGSIFVKPESLFLLNAEFIPFFYKSVPLVFSLTGIFLSILLYSRYGYVSGLKFFKTFRYLVS